MALLTLSVPSLSQLYNSLGIGEVANVPVAAAIADAVEDAVGARIKSLPVTAEKVFGAFKG